MCIFNVDSKLISKELFFPLSYKFIYYTSLYILYEAENCQPKLAKNSPGINLSTCEVYVVDVFLRRWVEI